MTGRLKANDKVHYIGQTTFTIDRSYTELKLIGKGSYGVVVSALDHSQQTPKKVAIKKITPITRDTQDAKHVLREMRLMRHMGKHENIITLYDLHIRESADELYIVMELLDSDLHKVLQSPQKLTNGHFRHFLFQLLCGVKYLHDNRIIHRDLKPGNLLVSRDCRLRITDFGLARARPESGSSLADGVGCNDEIDEPMTEHVVTRWYRPPELMLCPDGLYTYAIDMWSCGCIFAEMLARRPLFPGKNFIDQLTLIFNVIGSPSNSDTQHIENNQAKKFLATQRGKPKVLFHKLFPTYPQEAIQIMETLLIFKPSDRLTCDETLLLPYFDEMPSSASMVFPKTSSLFEFKFERLKGTGLAAKSQLKHLIVGEVASVKKQVAARRGSGSGSGKGSGEGERRRAAGSGTAAGAGASSAAAGEGGSVYSTSTNTSTTTSRTVNKQTRHSSSGRGGCSRPAAGGSRAGRGKPPSAQPPYRTASSQRPVRSSAPPANPSADAAAAITQEERMKSTGYGSRRDAVPTTSRRKHDENGNKMGGEDSDSDGDGQPDAMSREEPEHTSGRFGGAPIKESEDFSAAREYLFSTSRQQRPDSGARNDPSDMNKYFRDKGEKECDYESPDESRHMPRNDHTILNSPSRLNRSACKVLSDTTYANKAMELLHRTATSAADIDEGGDVDNGDDGVIDDDSDCEGSESSEEDIVAKMYRLYGHNTAETSTVTASAAPEKSRPISAVGSGSGSGSGREDIGVGNTKLVEEERPRGSYNHGDDEVEEVDSRSRVSGGKEDYHPPGHSTQRHGLSNSPREEYHADSKGHGSRGVSAGVKRGHRDEKESKRNAPHREADITHRVTERIKERSSARDSDRHTTAPAAAAPKKRANNVTVPQSPQFSKMSWQRNREAKQDQSRNRPSIPERYTAEQARKARASSASRVRPTSQRVNGPNGTTTDSTSRAHLNANNTSRAGYGLGGTGAAAPNEADSQREFGAGRRKSAGYAAPTAATMGRSASSGRLGRRY